MQLAWRHFCSICSLKTKSAGIARTPGFASTSNFWPIDSLRRPIGPVETRRRQNCHAAISARAPARPRRLSLRRPGPSASPPSCRAGAGPILPALLSATFAAPTLLIVGGRDEHVIPLNEMALDRLGAKTKHLTIIPGATHLFEEPGTLEEVARLATEWFRRHLRPGSA